MMHTCKESKKYNGRIWVCESDEFYNPVSGWHMVRLDGYHKPFKAKFLQQVEIPHGIPIIPTQEQISEWLNVTHPVAGAVNDIIHKAFMHFMTAGQEFDDTIHMNYFDGKLSLTIPLPPEAKINYESKCFVEKVHDLLAEQGVTSKADLVVYYPDLVRMIEDCERNQIPIQPFNKGFSYVGEKLNVSFICY